MSTTVTISHDTLRPFLASLPAKLRNANLYRAMGRGLANSLRANFTSLQGSRPNKQGWPRQGYWARAARSVTQPRLDLASATGAAVTVSITEPGIAARYYGPTVIKPVTAKTLAIPAVPEAYGTRPIDARWTGKLEFSMVGGKNMAFVARENFFRVVSRGKNKGQRRYGTGEKNAKEGFADVVFWLRRSVTIPEDKSVLPPDAVMLDAAVAAGQEYVNAVLEAK
jgi:hypothetical protein